MATDRRMDVHEDQNGCLPQSRLAAMGMIAIGIRPASQDRTPPNVPVSQRRHAG